MGVIEQDCIRGSLWRLIGVGSIEGVLKTLESIDDERYVVVYRDYDSFRKIYLQHAKKQIENNEVVVRRLVSHAIVSGKSGICIIADMGAFFLIDRVAKIASGRIKVRGFCTYHQRDLKLSEGQRKAIFGKGYRALIVQQTS